MTTSDVPAPVRRSSLRRLRDASVLTRSTERLRAFADTERQPARAQPSLGRGAAIAIVLGGALAALLAPGRFSPDALDMYNQSRIDRYVDWHSPILDGVWGFFDLAPELVLLLFLTMVMVGAMLLVASETTVRWAILTAAFVCVWPMTVGVLATVSKDAWFLGFFLTAAAASAFAFQRTGRTRWILVAITAIGFWLAVAARPNTIVPVAAVLAFGWPLAAGSDRRAHWFGRQGLKRIGLALVLAAAVLLTQRVWTDVVVDPGHVHPEQPTYQFDLAALSLRTGEMLLPASSLLPGTDLDDIRRVFDDGEGAYLWFGPQPVLQFYVPPDAVAELREAWLQAIRDHPVAMIEHRLWTAASVLNLDRPTYVVYEVPADPAAWRYEWRLHEPFFPSVSSWIEGTVATWGWYGWFRAWAFTLLLAVIGLSPRGRRSVAIRTLTAAGIGSLLSFIAAGTSGGFRYGWFTMVCALLALGIALSWICEWLGRRRRSRQPRPEPERSEGAAAADLGALATVGADRREPIEDPPA